MCMEGTVGTRVLSIQTSMGGAVGVTFQLWMWTLSLGAGWLEQLRPSQRSQVQREQRQLGGRGQLERQNRTVQSGNRHPKRRDRAAARRSGANNNRKC